MNILIVLAHPEVNSFNGRMARFAEKQLGEWGHKVAISDLFKDNFKSHADQQDFPDYSADFFDLQCAQQMSHSQGNVSPDIRKEQDKLLWADLVIFQFPLWWYSVPAPLKAYFDRVFSYGFAYGGVKALLGKRVVISTSTGAPKQAWTKEKKGTIDQVLFPIIHGTFALLGLHVEDPFVAYGVKRMENEEKQHVFASFKDYLAHLF